MTELSQAAALPNNIQTTVPVFIEIADKEVQVITPAVKPDAASILTAEENEAITAAFEPVQKLRKKGEDIETRYFAPGRQAMIDMLGECYEVYLGVQNSAIRERLIKRLKFHLQNNDGYEERANSSLTGLFLRYVFKNLDSKQVHQYGVAMAHAEANGVAADGWATFIKREGGFEKIRAALVEKKKGTTAAAATEKDCSDLIVANAGKALATVQLEDFEVDTEVVLLAARKNADGSFDLFDLALGDREPDVINRCWGIMKDCKKPAKRRALTADEKIEKLNADAAVHNQEMIVGDLEARIKSAGPIEADRLRTKLVLAQATLDAFKVASKQFRKLLIERE